MNKLKAEMLKGIIKNRLYHYKNFNPSNVEYGSTFGYLPSIGHVFEKIKTNAEYNTEFTMLNIHNKEIIKFCKSGLNWDIKKSYEGTLETISDNEAEELLNHLLKNNWVLMPITEGWF
jgi:hypothetical protein